MEFTNKLLIFFLTSLALAVSAYAQVPGEPLQQMVEQLQKTPNNNTLREQIIKLAVEIKPAPAIPEEARRSFVEGVTIVKSAKEPSSQKLAIESFNEALKIAPWWGDAYYNLAVTQELTGQLDDAERTLKWFMLSNPGESDARDAQDRIYAIGAKRKLAAAEAAAKREQENSPQALEAALLQKVEGARFVYSTNGKDKDSEVRTDDIYEIKDRTLILTYRIYSYTSPNLKYGKGPAHGDYLIGRAPYRDGVFNLSFEGGFTQVYRIRPDGQALIAVEGFYNRNPNDRTFGYQSLVIPRE